MIDSDPGIKNNQVVVKKTDFEVFQALDVDAIGENSNELGNQLIINFFYIISITNKYNI